MTKSHPPDDDELSRRLHEWRGPDPPAHLDARMWATYRQGAWKRRSWRLVLTSSVRVPLPVAVGVVLLCALSTFAALRPGRLGTGRPGAELSVPAGPTPVPPAPASETPAKDLSGFEPAAEMKVTILNPGAVR